MKKILALLLALTMLAACLPMAMAENESFTFISTEPNTLNMLQSQSNLDTYVFYLTSAMLFRSVDEEVIPELCDTMTVSEDGCTYTYTIKDAVYSDGTAIKAADFVYYMVNSAWLAMQTYNILGKDDTLNNGLTTCEGIQTIDDKTFSITLAMPSVTFTGELGIYPLPQSYAEEKGDALGGTPADMLYSGPYIMTDWVMGSSMTFEKNPSYINADTLFPVQEVTLLVAADASTAYAMYVGGEADAIVSVNSDYAELMDEAELSAYPSGNLWGIEFNTTGFTFADGNFGSRGEEVTALMKNINFRKALCAALDRNLLVEAVDSCSTPWNRYTSERTKNDAGDGLYNDAYPMQNVIALEGDVDAAKGYLDAALSELGYTSVSELPQITFLTFENARQKLMVETIVSLWKQTLGIENVVIELQPIQSAMMSMVFQNYDVYLQQLGNNKDNKFEMLNFWTTTGGVADAAQFQASGVPSFMASMHSNADFDAMMAALETNFDAAARMEGLRKAEETLYNDFVYFPIMAGGGVQAVKTYVEGWVSPYVEDGYGIATINVNK